MLKKIIIGAFLLITAVTLAQQGTTSPYSFFGIGTLKFRGTAENKTMAGMSVYADSIHLNLQNPAAVADLGLVNYTVGVSHRYITQKTTDFSQNQSTTALDYVAIGIPFGKLATSFGLIPFTSVGYNISSVTDNSTTQYIGEGGLNKAFLNFGYKVTPKFSVGVEANYNFGNIENVAFNIQEGLELGSREINRSDLLGFSFNIGGRYRTMVTKDLELQSSLSYTPETNFTSENFRQRATVFINEAGNQLVRNEIEVAVGDTEFTFPSQWTLGAGIGKPKNWFIGAEYTDQKTSNFTNRTFELENVTFTDASKFKIGGFFIPNYNSLGNYYKRVVYRAGIRFEETGLEVNGEGINEFGISFGLGLPVGRLFSNANIGFEIGRRGTTDSGLIQENFVNTFISLSLNDKWFDKRYLD